jgi:hypothetical protein
MGCAGSLYPAVQEIFPKDTGVFLEYSGKAEGNYPLPLAEVALWLLQHYKPSI